MWVVLPHFDATFRIEREDVVVRRAEEQLAFHQDWRDFKRRLTDHLRLLLHRTRAVGPGQFQLRDVATIDLPRGGVSRAAAIVAIVRPSSIGRRLPSRNPRPAQHSHCSQKTALTHRYGPFPSLHWPVLRSQVDTHFPATTS